MTKNSLILLLGIALPIFTFAAEGNVAILDIDEAARQLGVQENVRIDLERMQEQLNNELNSSKAELQKEMQAVEAAAGEEPNEEELKQLRATNQQLNNELITQTQKAKVALETERNRLIATFRNRLEPIAMMAAKKKGFSIVLMKATPPVFAYAPEVDITAETIELAIEAGLKEEPKEVSSEAATTTEN